MRKYGTARQAKIRRMRLACRITKATETRTEYVLIALPRQKLLSERAAILRHSYTAVLL